MLKQLNQAMDYIETHLAAEIDFQQLAGIAGCSEYHFRRMFSFLSGMTLNEYIRLRRLSQAALELRHSESRIIDLAVQYGYDSPDALSRAFQQFHGVKPSAARRAGVQLKAVAPMTFQLMIQGGSEMDYRIIEKEAFHIVGNMKQVSLIYEGVNPEIASMWQALTEEDIHALKALSDTDPKGLLSASLNFEQERAEGSTLDHYIGVASTQAPIGKWQVLEVPASTWAVFTVRGAFPDALQKLWSRIYGEWFAMSGYEVSPGPEILWNESKDTTLPDFHSEIWIPVKQQ